MAATYVWTGKTLRGTIANGEMSGNTKEDVIATLRRQGIIPTVVSEKKAGDKKITLFSRARLKVTDKDLVVFTRQFATMFTAGVPIVQALDILARQIDNKAFGDVVAQVKVDVEKGNTLAEAFKRHPRVFSDLYVNMVAAGEAGGVLDTVLLRLANYIEKAMKLKKKVKGAMIYPSIVIGVAALVIAVIMIFVIPIFSALFSDMGVALPLPTRIVVSASNFIAGIGGILLFFGFIGAILGIRQFRRTENGKKITDTIVLRVPLVGELLKKVAVARFSRTLGTLISSGVPILTALDICARTSGNKVIEEVILGVKKEVAAGTTVAEPLSRSKVFAPMVVQMISVGESTGALDQMLSKIADFYDDEVENTVANLMTMLEPALMVFLGTTIGFIVVALYLPIFKMGDVLTK